MHISKDNADNDNNNVTRSVYQASVTITQGLEWILNSRKFNIMGENLPKNSQNILLTLGSTSFVTNVIANDFQINNKLISVVPNHKITFIDLCDFFDEDGMLPIFVHPFNFSLLILTCSIQILSTCCLKFTLLFSVSWNALK